VESFGGRLRDELLAVEAFSSLLEASGAGGRLLDGYSPVISPPAGQLATGG
jgi:hypothetical protein